MTLWLFAWLFPQITENKWKRPRGQKHPPSSHLSPLTVGFMSVKAVREDACDGIFVGELWLRLMTVAGSAGKWATARLCLSSLFTGTDGQCHTARPVPCWAKAGDSAAGRWVWLTARLRREPGKQGCRPSRPRGPSSGPEQGWLGPRRVPLSGSRATA